MPDPKLVYPVDLGIKITTAEGSLSIEFPRTRMACLVSA
jgi:ribonuclease PH